MSYFTAKERSMLEKILPNKLHKILTEKVNMRAVNEIRLRADKPVIVNVSGKNFFLCENGVTQSAKNALCSTKVMIEDVVFRASECSIYSVNEQIKRGFIITDEAVRIGIGGNIVEENGVIKTMTNFTSCNIRVPHAVHNCSLKALPYILHDGVVENTLVVSPPGAGKTTFLRDFVTQLSERGVMMNVLLLDERGELDCGMNSDFVDRIAFSSKKVGFENGIRSLSPDIIVTDEIGQSEDVDAIFSASMSGVKVLASTHADSMEIVSKKPLFDRLLKEKIFHRFVLLSKRNGPGTLEGVYNENLSRVYASQSAKF